MALAQRSLAAYFSPQRSWASLFEAFLQPVIGRSRFQDAFRSGAFLTDHEACYRRFNGFIPPRSAVPLFAPEVLIRVGAIASLRFLDLLGTPSSEDAIKRLSRKLPSHPLNETALPQFHPGIPGFPSSVDWLSPSVEGAGPSDLFHRLSCATFSKVSWLRPIFSVKRLFPVTKKKRAS
jgi:hypothetical protein